MISWDYGNARIRALRSRLFDVHGYRELLRATNIESLLGALAATPYRPDTERALSRAPDLRRLDEVLRIHLTRVLTALPTWFEGEARAHLERLLARWDWVNLRTILRGLAQQAPATEIEPLLVPAGRLDAGALATLARQETVSAVNDLLRSWGLASRGLPDQLWASSLEPEEVDRVNVVNALRRRGARLEDGVEADEDPLVGGTISARTLDNVAHEKQRGHAAALLPAPWPQRLARWVADGDLVALSDALDETARRRAMRLFGRCDPLGPDIARAYIAAKENEVRNLRRIGRGVEAGWPPGEIEKRLVFA
ncbi:MAG: V-type ATPase subunit [Planctomycetota bacterium]|jgi:V/A-type H+-transporting ATPase subunit C